MTDEFSVKGSSLRSKLDYVRQRFGEDAARRLLDHLGREVNLPILDSTWYPAYVYEEVLAWIARHCLAGEVEALRQVGVESAREALTGVYASFARRRDLEPALKRLPLLHGRYYSEGRLEVETQPGGPHTLTLVGAPRYSREDIEVAAGFYQGVAMHLGYPRATCQYVKRQDRVVFTLEEGHKA